MGNLYGCKILQCRAADQGNNVLYVTLEMSERKVMKRLGVDAIKDSDK